jgi:hypothetical protein
MISTGSAKREEGKGGAEWGRYTGWGGEGKQPRSRG